jgi:hypothetical protein
MWCKVLGDILFVHAERFFFAQYCMYFLLLQITHIDTLFTFSELEYMLEYIIVQCVYNCD